MSAKQWGHGFHSGVNAALAKSGTLAGLWFHSWKDGEIHWQGRVERDLPNGTHLVQLFEWGNGDPTVQKIVPFESMKGWDFYASDRDMRYAYNKYAKGSEEDFEWGEKCVAQARQA